MLYQRFIYEDACSPGLFLRNPLKQVQDGQPEPEERAEYCHGGHDVWRGGEGGR